MELPKIELKLITPTEASIEVDGVAVGNITLALQEQETIDGIDNAIVVLGDCENVQDNSHHGFVFSLVKTLPEPDSEQEQELELQTRPDNATTEPKEE